MWRTELISPVWPEKGPEEKPDEKDGKK
jgi:hypothetical protein